MPATDPLDLRQSRRIRDRPTAERPEAVDPRTHAPPETWVPLSRSLRQHLRGLSGNAVKLYLLLLLSARFSGPHKGQVAASFAELALELGLHRTSVHRAAKELRLSRLGGWKAARNQHGVTLFTVLDYKTVADFAGNATLTARFQRADSSAAANSKSPSQLQFACATTAQARGQHAGSTAANYNNQNDLQPACDATLQACVKRVYSNASNYNNPNDLKSPKNYKNYNKSQKKEPRTRCRAHASTLDPQLASELRVGLGPQLTTGRVKPEALERDRRRREAERQADLARQRAKPG